MLNAKALSTLLTQNRDERLCKRWFLMTPNGTLLAYSQPGDINDLRRQAAFAALAWQEHTRQTDDGFMDGPDPPPSTSTQPETLRCLTIESESANILIRKLQKHLLLGLEGGVPPRRSTFERRVTAEAEDGTIVSPHQSEANTISNLATSASSRADSSTSSANVSVLQVQRRKMDALARAIVAEFEQTGFKMPEEGNTTFF